MFKQKLEEKLEKKDFNFRGYCFPEAINFYDIEFVEYANFIGASFKNANFNGVVFQKDAVFAGASFQKDAYFEDAIFKNHAGFYKACFEDAYFEGTIFQKDANFEYAAFQEASFSEATFQNAYFSEATFQNAYFYGAVIKEYIDFVTNRIEEFDLQNTKFFFRGNITADLSKAKFYRAHLENVAFIDCTWPKEIYEEVHMKDEELSFKELETTYRNLKQNMQRHGDYSRAGEFYYREMEMKRKGSNSRKERVWLGLYNLLAGYGEKPERTALSSIFTISIFALLYWVLECLQYPAQNLILLHQLKYAVYFSFVTFTTLGLGDIRPVNDWGIVLICCEAVIGAFLIALFVVVFARKMMR